MSKSPPQRKKCKTNIQKQKKRGAHKQVGNNILYQASYLPTTLFFCTSRCRCVFTLYPPINTVIRSYHSICLPPRRQKKKRRSSETRLYTQVSDVQQALVELYQVYLPTKWRKKSRAAEKERNKEKKKSDTFFLFCFPSRTLPLFPLGNTQRQNTSTGMGIPY